MKEVLKFFDVASIESYPSGFIVEDCGVQYPDLDGYCIYCSQYNMNPLKEWVLANANVNVDHFKNTFDSKPKQSMSFVAMVQGIKSYTEELVCECGGVQQFLDRYCKGSDSAQVLVADDQGGVDEGEEVVDLQDATEPEVQDEAEPVATPVAAPVQPIQPDVALIQEREEMIRAATDLRLEAERMLEDAKQRQEEVQRSEAAVREKMESVRDIFDVSGNLIAFSNRNTILKTLERLHSLNEEIHLDGMSKDELLTADDVPSVVGLLESLSPRLYKRFFIDYVKSITENASDFDVIRRSALVNDLAGYIAAVQ